MISSIPASQAQPNRSSKAESHMYKNIMEDLVQQEVSRQLAKLPLKLAAYIDPVEVETFALNHLPPLYASSEEGKNYQFQKGQKNLQQEIMTSVRHAILAVQRDPLRTSKPLEPSDENQTEVALRRLEHALRESQLLESDDQKLTWENLLIVVTKALKKTAEKGILDQHLQQILTEWEQDRYVPSIFEWQDQRYVR